MRSLISALAAAGLLMSPLSCYSADAPYAGQSKAEKPGRAVTEESTVNSPARPEQARRTARKTRQSSPAVLPGEPGPTVEKK